MECGPQLRAVLDDPPVDGRVVDQYATFLHEFFHMACTQRIRYVPPHPHENDLLREMGSFEADGHRSAPSLIMLNHGGRSYLKEPQLRIATDPL
jgi:hypothetical protein